MTKLNYKIISLAFARYKSLNEEDKEIVNSLVVIDIMAIILYAITDRYLHESIAGVLLTIILLPIIVSVTFATIDKMNILTPIERRLENITSIINENSALVRKEQEEEFKLITSALMDVTIRLNSYIKYDKSSRIFGFTSVEGLLAENAGVAPVYVSTNLPLNIIKEAQSGSEVKYMTSFINDDVTYQGVMRQAITKGVSIKLLLMKPKSSSAVVNARFIDAFKRQFDDDIEIFTRFIKARAETFERLAREAKRNPHAAGFDLRYFDMSLNFPMIYVRRHLIGGGIDETIYTGFYGTSSAEDLPYIEWRGGDMQIVSRLVAIFDSKWAACKPVG